MTGAKSTFGGGWQAAVRKVFRVVMNAIDGFEARIRQLDFV